MPTVWASYACVLVIDFDFLLASCALVTHTTSHNRKFVCFKLFLFALSKRVLHCMQENLTSTGIGNISSPCECVAAFCAFPYPSSDPSYGWLGTLTTYMRCMHAFLQICNQFSIFSTIPGSEPACRPGNSSFPSELFCHSYILLQLQF